MLPNRAQSTLAPPTPPPLARTRAVIGAYDYVFAENGLVAYKGDQLIAKQSLRTHLGEANIKEFVNFILHYVSGVGEGESRARATMDCG